MAAGEFVVFLDHDDRLHPHALATVVAYLNKDKEIDILYSDEDKLDEYGNRKEPFLNRNGARIFFCLKITLVISQFTGKRL